MNAAFPENIGAFRLSNGETVYRDELERQIGEVCHYIRYVIISSETEDQPVAIIFPDKKQLDAPGYKLTPEEGCFCPRTIEELGKCLTGCIGKINGALKPRLKYTAIVDTDPPVKYKDDNSGLRARLQKMFAENITTDKEVYVVRLNNFK